MNKITNIKKYILLLTVILASCKSPETFIKQETIGNQGNLGLVANGEDFVRQGWLAKDGWKIEFDRLEVPVSEVIAYNLNSEPESDWENYLKSQLQVLILDQVTNADLAAGDANASPIIVSQKQVLKRC